MKIIVFVLMVVFQGFSQAKNATIKGFVKDKNTPMPFANVFIKNTKNGTNTDFEGNFILKVPAGKHILVVSFMGYATLEIPFEIKNKEQKIMNATLKEKTSGKKLKNITLKSQVSKEKESALLAEQKGATIIKESIGAKRLATLGIANASAATAKISGVDKSQNTGAIFIRGLSDRYLATTMNGLPIPSDDVSNKNINLNLFSTNILQNISLSKTYDVKNYADNASGNVDISSKMYTKNYLKIGISLGANENVRGENFKKTVMSEDSFLGFYNQKKTLKENTFKQKWDPQKVQYPFNRSISLAKGHKWRFKNAHQMTSFLSLSYRKNDSFRRGSFKNYRAHVLRNSFTDTEVSKNIQTTTGFLDLGYQFNNEHKIHYNFLFVNKMKDQVFEQGRNVKGFVYDQDPKETEAFIRDQNLLKTRLSVQQILGTHTLKNHKIKWAFGWNDVLAEEPNRIRNEGNIYKTYFQFAHVADFQQRKSSQSIQDKEYNGFVKHTWDFLQKENKNLKFHTGFNFRSKKRDFESLFIGVGARLVKNEQGINHLSTTFTKENFDNGKLALREIPLDTYYAKLNIGAFYMSADWKFGKISGNAGFRYENSHINVTWDVGNYTGREGKTTKNYGNLFPAIHIKYNLKENQILRLAFSKTNTLPEFKELAPFEYVSPNGRVSKGYEKLERSENQNIDLKYAIFPSKTEIFSLTAFYKYIKNPINLAQMRGSSGYFRYRNTGDQATVLGLELEARWDVLKKEQKPILSIGANFTKMWIEQDLLDEFEYSDTKKTQLQGAAPMITNVNIRFQTQNKNPFEVNISGNYTQDKIFVLGAPEDYKNRNLLYNAPILEKGFIRLDLITTKHFSKKINMRLVVKNLLNPEIKQTQKMIKDLNTKIKSVETVSNYKMGRQINISMNYIF